jgi:hypothetical protein
MKSRYANDNPQIQLSANELLAISEEISKQYAPITIEQETELQLMPVDPYHLYAYWNLSQKQIRQVKNFALRDMSLRIFWLPDTDSHIATTKLWFDVAVKSIQQRLKVRLPIDQTSYFATLGRHCANHCFEIMARSNIIHVPRGRMAPVKPEAEMSLAMENNNAEAGEKRVMLKPEKTTEGAEFLATNESSIDTEIRQILFNKGFLGNIGQASFSQQLNSNSSHFSVSNQSGKN